MNLKSPRENPKLFSEIMEIITDALCLSVASAGLVGLALSYCVWSCNKQHLQNTPHHLMLFALGGFLLFVWFCASIMISVKLFTAKPIEASEEPSLSLIT